MNMNVRNHLASLCSLYVKYNHPVEFARLQKLAEENYSEGYRAKTLASVWKRYAAEKRQNQLIQEEMDKNI